MASYNAQLIALYYPYTYKQKNKTDDFQSPYRAALYHWLIVPLNNVNVGKRPVPETLAAVRWMLSQWNTQFQKYREQSHLHPELHTASQLQCKKYISNNNVFWPLYHIQTNQWLKKNPNITKQYHLRITWRNRPGKLALKHANTLMIHSARVSANMQTWQCSNELSDLCNSSARTSNPLQVLMTRSLTSA